MTRVYLWPELASCRKENGIGRIAHAQHDHLPALGIELVGEPKQAQVMACHTQRGNAPRVDVLHCHGMYFSDLGHAPYVSWHREANQHIAQAAREALTITVPSRWVAEPFRRDMRINPEIVPHGVEADLFSRIRDDGYLLWNKNRNADVCDPMPAYELARRGVPVVSTFLPLGVTEKPKMLRVCGKQSWENMREIICMAHVYLATTRETFGVGTLEAMAAGVPVLGYAWGGTLEIVRHKIEGYLAAPGDIDGLLEGIRWIEANYAEASASAAARARWFTWDRAMRRYAEIYREAERKLEEQRDDRVTVVIPCYNYGRYLPTAVESVLKQTHPPAEVIIIDDGSKDTTANIGKELAARNKSVTYIRQGNRGVASARNHGVALAKTPFVLCLDADDWVDVQFLNVCVRAMLEDRSLGIAYTGLLVHYPDGTTRQFTWPPPFSWETQAKAMVPPANCVPSASLFRKEMWRRAGGYVQDYAPGEDAEFWTRGLSVGFTARQVSEARLFHYLAHGASASRTKTYVPIDEHHPWMRDGLYPMAAPAGTMPDVQSYSDPAVAVIVSGGPFDDWTRTLDDLVGQTMRQWETWLVALDGLPDRIREVYPFARVVADQDEIKSSAPFTAEFRAGEPILAIMLERELRDAAADRSNGRSRLKENDAMGCCGGNRREEIMRNALSAGIAIPEDAKVSAEGMVRMEFIGLRTGAVTYYGHKGRAYRGGNSALHRYADVNAADVAKLVSTGHWKIIRQTAALPVAEIFEGVPDEAPGEAVVSVETSPEAPQQEPAPEAVPAPSTPRKTPGKRTTKRKASSGKSA